MRRRGRLADKRYARSAAENHQVGLDQGLFGFLSLLLLAFRQDQFFIAQRLKICGESAGLYKTGNIEVHRIAHRRVWVADHHLAGVN